MRIVETTIEPVSETRFRVITTIDVEAGRAEGESPPPASEIGDGPTGDAIPDQIVRCLIENRPGSMALHEIKRVVGGHPGTVARQAWTLATNAPDLQHRLRGWVVKVDRGYYGLSAAALQRLDGAGGR